MWAEVPLPSLDSTLSSRDSGGIRDASAPVQALLHMAIHRGRLCVSLAVGLAAFPELASRRLHRELRERGYTGGYTRLADLLRDIRPVALPGFEQRFEGTTLRAPYGEITFALSLGKPAAAA